MPWSRSPAWNLDEDEAACHAILSAVLSYGIATRVSARLASSAGVADPPFHWAGTTGPWLENCLATLADTPQGLKLWWVSGVGRRA